MCSTLYMAKDHARSLAGHGTREEGKKYIYHETNKTYTRNFNKSCAKIIGYDANAFYLWVIAQKMPVGKHEHISEYNLDKLNEDIINKNLFGFIPVDIETTEH